MQTFSAQFAESRYPAGMAGILRLIRGEMELVEAEFARQANSNVQVISYLGEYLRASGGKRVRPALLVLANKAAGGEGSSENVIRLATVMEMIHTATLVHDDIIDNAATRRNTVTVNAKFGNQAAVLMGDWLYMSAFETSLKERSLEILYILTELTRKMTEGELIQLTMLGRTDISEEDYFDILRRKTAYLFSACCEIGAILAGADPNEREELRNYGMNLGTAFQLADDVLDFTADKQVLGKASGADLLEGKLTLPLILLVRKDPSVCALLEQIMRTGEYDSGIREQLLGKLEKSGTLEETRSTAHRFAAKAVKNLELLPETRYGEALGEVPSLMINRKN
ncbi:MAG: polyprenyl synthetase family protein [Acidobacteria bacterium]|nr:MAG: polyprenyl synthetase family protein [Acidobacteriota bacterium]REK01540.1 MAG: polyprenyl synthetase family protein [Acidobacteriota bacterium]REK14496.1 MAG: polyprenyl synthetase family protein [Acidobacteriota bacterium]REK45211.1 MAG: polyprenyl synthetase family protein [Acidobacteriota bacterium]